MAVKDSFDPAAVIAPTKVKSVEIVLTIVDAIPAVGGDPGTPTQYTARYSFDQLAANDVIVEVRQGNLTPYLTPSQITTAKAFMDSMLAKAKASIS